MENMSFGQSRMGICPEESHGQTERAVVLKEMNIMKNSIKIFI
jgi:hypothetical protein